MKWADILKQTTKRARLPPATVRLIVSTFTEQVLQQLSSFNSVDMQPLGWLKFRYKKPAYRYDVNAEVTRFISGRWLVVFVDLNHWQASPFNQPRQHRPVAEVIAAQTAIDMLSTRLCIEALLSVIRENVAAGQSVPMPYIGKFYRYDLAASTKWDEWHKKYISVPARFKVAMVPAKTVREVLA